MENDMESWTSKHRPESVKDLVGNVNVLKDAMRYLKSYKCSRSKNTDFAKGILITGPSGVGKTELARLLALYRGYIPLEFNTSDLRKKQEVSDMVDVYRSDIRHNFKSDASILVEARKNLDACGLSKYPIGKAIIIDELDAMSKGQKGIQTMLVNLLNEGKVHTPNRILIFTCSEDDVSKFKSIKSNCYSLKLKSITDGEMIKLVDRVAKAEGIELRKEDKENLAKFSNGDCRRLLNSMEVCFTNGMNVSDMSANKLSKMIQDFVDGDEETLTRMKLSSLSTEKLLEKIIREVSIQEKDQFKLVSYIKGDSRVLAKQLFHTYPMIIRQDIGIEDQFRYACNAVEFMSFGDVYMGGGGDDQFMDIEKYTLYSVLGPLAELKGGVANNFRMNVKGYAKIDGETRSMEAQYDLKSKLGALSGHLRNKTFEELRYIAVKIAEMLKEKKYDEVSEMLYELGVEPTILDDFVKIKILKHGNRLTQLSDIWKATAKRNLKKKYNEDRVRYQTRGLKFKDDKNRDKRRKVDFFGKYDSLP